MNGPGCNVIIGISGGKDSLIVASLCIKALGKDRVIGVQLPNGIQKDIDCSNDIFRFLDIKKIYFNIGSSCADMLKELSFEIINISEQTKMNLPARMRMSALYAISQSLNGRVANTCNLSEDWVGYSTRYGDSAGDFSPLCNLTVTEILQIGEYLDLPQYLINKIPEDGLCGKTDEENLGFTYVVLDKYIREGICECESTKLKIDEMHKKNKFKLELMPGFDSHLPIKI
jgi:NAD+ synthase